MLTLKGAPSDEPVEKVFINQDLVPLKTFPQRNSGTLGNNSETNSTSQLSLPNSFDALSYEEFTFDSLFHGEISLDNVKEPRAVAMDSAQVWDAFGPQSRMISQSRSFDNSLRIHPESEGFWGFSFTSSDSCPSDLEDGWFEKLAGRRPTEDETEENENAPFAESYIGHFVSKRSLVMFRVCSFTFSYSSKPALTW